MASQQATGARSHPRPPRDARLLDLLDELRALDRERHMYDFRSGTYRDLSRRVEETVREVFRVAGSPDISGGARSGSRAATGRPGDRASATVRHR